MTEHIKESRIRRHNWLFCLGLIQGRRKRVILADGFPDLRRRSLPEVVKGVKRDQNQN